MNKKIIIIISSIGAVIIILAAVLIIKHFISNTPNDNAVIIDDPSYDTISEKDLMIANELNNCYDMYYNDSLDGVVDSNGPNIEFYNRNILCFSKYDLKNGEPYEKIYTYSDDKGSWQEINDVNIDELIEITSINKKYGGYYIYRIKGYQ